MFIHHLIISAEFLFHFSHILHSLLLQLSAQQLLREDQRQRPDFSCSKPLQPVSEVPPLYKYTMTPPCCHSTEQCTSAEYVQKNCTNIQKLQLRCVIGGMGKQEQDRKESGAIVEWPYRLSLWQGHYWTLGTCTQTHSQSNICKEIRQAHPQGL